MARYRKRCFSSRRFGMRRVRSRSQFGRGGGML